MDIRQGDVGITKVKALPQGKMEARKRDAQGRLVLAYGEVTGHAHALVGDDVEVYVSPTGEVYVQAKGPVSLVHEEHVVQTIELGIYRVDMPCEYDEGEARQVAD